MKDQPIHHVPKQKNKSSEESPSLRSLQPLHVSSPAGAWQHQGNCRRPGTDPRHLSPGGESCELTTKYKPVAMASPLLLIASPSGTTKAKRCVEDMASWLHAVHGSAPKQNPLKVNAKEGYEDSNGETQSWLRSCHLRHVAFFGATGLRWTEHHGKLVTPR